MKTKILNLCKKCIELLDGFDHQVAKHEEQSICEMCGKKGIVQAVRINGKATNEQRDYSYPQD